MGSQSADYAFDAVAFLPGLTTEHIACEVKKSTVEVEQLLRDMSECCIQVYRAEDAKKFKADPLNAYKKVWSLIKRRAPIFWIVCPYGLSRVFTVSYTKGGIASLDSGNENLLFFMNNLEI